MTDRSEANRRIYGSPEAIKTYSFEGWQCPAEEELLTQLLTQLHHAPLLDVGVGAGRTVALLEPFTDRYIGIDFAPEMIDAARQRHPGVDLRVLDARDLSDFDDGSFGAVVFTFNGLDVVGPRDRAVVLAELRRVLAPGGLLYYSTINMDSKGLANRPFKGLLALLRRAISRDPDTRRRFAAAFAICLVRDVRGFRNWLRTRRFTAKGDGWKVDTLMAHDYRLLKHMISAPAAITEAERAGFDVLAALGTSGADLLGRGRVTTESMICVLARRHPVTGRT